jgi:FkbM family methyltransferase
VEQTGIEHNTMKITYSEHTYFEDKISDTPVLIDLGSCRGDFSKHFISRYNNAKIIMVEPSRTNFAVINQDLVLNNKNIKKQFFALSDKSGKKLTFHEDPSSEQNGSILFNYFNGLPYEVETISLDDIVKPFDHVDLVKMDVEGAEWDCIMNLTEETISKISQLTVEFHDFIDPSLVSKTESAVKRLLDFGYKLEYSSTNWMYGSKYYDSLFYK